jgi:hypothetical protein
MGLMDTSNAFMTIGLTINQLANDDEALAFKSSDVAHGVTNMAETDTYGYIKKYDGTAAGLDITGFTEATVAMWLRGAFTTADTTESTSSTGAVMPQANIKSGTGVTNPGSDDNIFVVRNGSSARLIVKGGGDLWIDGTVSAFDEYDDVGLLRLATLETAVSGVIKSRYDQFITANREQLEAARLVTFNEDGRHFVNLTGMHKVQTGAIQQLHERLSRLEELLGA